MRSFSLACPLVCTFLLVAAARPTALTAGVQSGGFHQDERYGYKVRTPKDWDAIPIQLHDGWQIAKWMSDKTYFYTDPENGWTWEHKPTCKVVAFVTEVVRQRARATKVEEEGERIRILIDNPYRDYQDYLRRTYSGGGWHVAEETEGKVNGLKVTKYHIKVEKLAYRGPKRIEAWVFHTPEVDFAVEFEVLEDSWDKLAKTVTRTLKSFAEIPRMEAGLPTARTGVTEGFRQSESAFQRDLTPGERADRRRQLEASDHLKATETLPDDWEYERYGRILVLNHSRAKVGKQRAEQAQAVLDWLDDTLPFIGEGEYVRAPIIRICADWEEEQSYRKGGSGTNWGGMGTEITVHNDNAGKLGYETEWLNWRVLEIWFQDRDRALFWALPEWLEYGLKEVVKSSASKRGKVQFRVDDYERQGLRELGREDLLTPVQEMMLKGRDEFRERRDYRIVYEAQSLVRFLLCGEARKSAATRDVLPNYLENLKAVITEIEAEEAAKGEDKEPEPQTEEEEDELFRKKRQSWKDKERRILDETFMRTFGSWDSGDWNRFERTYFKTIK